ncbi:MAG: GntR family transcriptional regulator [Chloroflexota bacterium]|nr:GntR family transcriptional regulator [Chloroflexota bacterium]
MEQSFLYEQIIESIRQEILQGALQPGDRLPTLREIAGEWRCTLGTAQRAYMELARQGVVASRPGQGTYVADTISRDEEVPLRRARLVHQAEAFLLEAMTGGYTPSEVEHAVHLALDRWRAIAQQAPIVPGRILRFEGSHDPALALVATRFTELTPDERMELKFSGSLGGLIALEKGQADIAGSHLWDVESDRYNEPFVRRLLPGESVALLTLAHRRLGLIVPPGNPAAIGTLDDLAGPDTRLVNRQRGAGTRVWFDAALRRQGIEPSQLQGYEVEKSTQTDVARAIAEGEANVGPGIEAAALAYGLDFIFLTKERYELVMRTHVCERPSVQALAGWLASSEAKAAIATLGGYDTTETGQIMRLT